MANIQIGEAFKAGWKSFMQRPWYLFGLSLAVFLLFGLGSANNGFVAALAYIIYGGYLAVLLRHYNGQTIVFDDLFSLDSRWISFAFLALIKGLFICLGLVLFIVPGVYLAIRWMFAELLVIDQGMKPMQALRASRAMTKGHMWQLLWFAVASTIAVVIGLFVFIVGAAAASVVVTLALIKIYSDLKAQNAK
jgi:hypothetical protein